MFYNNCQQFLKICSTNIDFLMELSKKKENNFNDIIENIRKKCFDLLVNLTSIKEFNSSILLGKGIIKLIEENFIPFEVERDIMENVIKKKIKTLKY